jgi:thioredoxin 1
MSNSKNVFTATDANFQSEVMAETKLTLVDFWAEWCGPCRALGPTIEAIADEFEGKIKVLKLNVDENPAAAQAFHIRSIPTVVLVKNGQVLDQMLGAQSKDSYLRAIEKHA